MGASTESNCRKCARQTNHTILYETSHAADRSWFNERHTWQVLKCMGCNTVGFRYRLGDFDDVEELFDGETQHLIKYFRYPTALAEHRPLEYLQFVPPLIKSVYQQSLNAFAGESLILASIGLRATIEAVCNHLKISGSNLEKRIDALAKAGFISNNDKRRLHAIRFLGNDAAHEIKEPKQSELRVALEIVEHLIKSVFILEHRSKDLDVQVETFEAGRVSWPAHFLPTFTGPLRAGFFWRKTEGTIDSHASGNASKRAASPHRRLTEQLCD